MLPLDHFTECVSQRDCLKKKRKKKNKKGHTTVKHRWLKLQGHLEEWERRGEKETLSGTSVSLQRDVCVYVSVAQRHWTKEEALTGGWYIAKRLFTLMTSGPPLHHRSIHSFYSIHTAPAVSFLPLRPLHSASPLPLAHLAAPRFCCRAPSAALEGTRSC